MALEDCFVSELKPMAVCVGFPKTAIPILQPQVLRSLSWGFFNVKDVSEEVWPIIRTAPRHSYLLRLLGRLKVRTELSGLESSWEKRLNKQARV